MYFMYIMKNIIIMYVSNDARLRESAIRKYT